MTTVELSPAAGDARGWRFALAVVAVATAVRLILAGLLPLFPDETYYWEWSRRLAGGYFDHPPMIALLIRAGTALWPHGDGSPPPIAVRFFPVLAGGLATLAAVAIARRIGGARAALIASLGFALMPLAATGLVLATPDAPLLAASACGVYAVVRALQSPVRSRASLLWWCVAGIALGAAFASKYTSIFLPVCIVAAIVVRPSLRTRLREPGPYVACVIATLVFLPVLHWNAAHDWISFRFQVSHGLGARPKGSVLGRELALVGGQLGLVSPILFGVMAYAVWRAVRQPLDDVHFALAVVAVGSWLFFAYSAMRRSVEPNWPAPSYIPGIALLSSLAVRRSTVERWTRYGVILAGVLVAIVYLHALHPVLPIPARRDPVARSAGWSDVAAQIAAVRRTVVGTAWIGADRYQDASELAYHVPRADSAFCVCLTGRHNQYELWPGFPRTAKAGDALVLLLDDTPAGSTHVVAARLAPYFARVTRGPLAPLLRGNDTVATRRVYLLEGYGGGWPARAEP